MILFSSRSVASLSSDSTRYIFNDNKKSISLAVTNDSDREVGAQIWIDSDGYTSNMIFNPNPSFMTLKPGEKRTVRITKVRRKDKKDEQNNVEELFWINLQEIPPRVNEGVNVAIKTRVKLLNRPGSLDLKRDMAESKISLIKNKDGIYIENNTPYVFSTSDYIDDNGNSVFDKNTNNKLSRFKPGQKYKILNDNVSVLRFSALNDFGFIENHEINLEN